MTLVKYLIKSSSLVEPNQLPYNFPSLRLCSLQCRHIEKHLPTYDASMVLSRQYSLYHVSFSEHSRAPHLGTSHMAAEKWEQRCTLGQGKVAAGVHSSKPSMASPWTTSWSSAQSTTDERIQNYSMDIIWQQAEPTHTQLTYLSAFLQNQLHLHPRAV